MSSSSSIIKSLRTTSYHHMSRFLSSNTKLQQSPGHRFISNYTAIRNYNTHRRNFSVYKSVQQGPPTPSQPPSSSSRWVLGTVLGATILPFAGSKWGPLLKLKEDVDTVVDTIENIVEVVEKVAEVVDKVAENASVGLPEGGKLKKVVDVLEDVAEKTAKDAQAVGDAIDKLQEVEEKVENMVDALSNDKAKANEHTIDTKG